MKTIKFDSDYRKFSKWANRIGKSGLVECSSGNLSHLIQANTCLVSESRRWLSKLKPEQIVLVDTASGDIINGNKPTGELPLHLAIYRRNQNVTTVLHCQSPAATAIACSDKENIDYNVIIEVPIYCGIITEIPFIMPGSQELGEAVAEASLNSSVIQLRNHGQVIIGRNYKEVYQKAIFFELACSLILANNYQCRPLSQGQCKSLEGYR